MSCRERSLITSRGPGGRSRSWAGAWAASSPGKWPASIPGWSGRSSPWAVLSPSSIRATATLIFPTSTSATCTRPNPGCPAREQRARPIGLPSTSVYSRWDGVVPWQACIEPETALHQNVEVRCSHLGLGVDPATLWLIADRLAAPVGQRAPFRPPPLLRPLYPGRLIRGRSTRAADDRRRPGRHQPGAHGVRGAVGGPRLRHPTRRSGALDRVRPGRLRDQAPAALRLQDRRSSSCTAWAART